MEFATLILLFGGGAAILLIGGGVLLWRRLQRHAAHLGYPSVGVYLRAAPRTDEERKDAVDLALKGLTLCIVGLLFPPFLLIGPFPLFYGTRKVAWASMGLGLGDEVDRSGV